MSNYIANSQLFWKLHTENKILKQKNSILSERCEQYTSANKYITSSHKLQMDKYQCQIDQLKQKIQSLEESNSQLTVKCNVLRAKANSYRHKNKTLLHINRENESLSKKLEQFKTDIKTLNQENNNIKKELNNLKITEITPREQTITGLRIEMQKLHELFEKNKLRRASSATIKLQISDSKTIKYDQRKRLSESLSLNNSTSNRPRFFVHDSYNISPTPSVYRHNIYSKSRKRYTKDETGDEDNEYKYDKKDKLKLVHENSTVHVYYIDDEMSNIHKLNKKQLSPSVDSNDGTQDLVILDTYDLCGEDLQIDHDSVSPQLMHTCRSLLLRNSSTENADDVDTVINHRSV